MSARRPVTVRPALVRGRSPSRLDATDPRPSAITSEPPPHGCTRGPTTPCAQPASSSPHASPPPLPSFGQGGAFAWSRLAIGAGRGSLKPDGKVAHISISGEASLSP